MLWVFLHLCSNRYFLVKGSWSCLESVFAYNVVDHSIWLTNHHQTLIVMQSIPEHTVAGLTVKLIKVQRMCLAFLSAFEQAKLTCSPIYTVSSPCSKKERKLAGRWWLSHKVICVKSVAQSEARGIKSENTAMGWFSGMKTWCYLHSVRRGGILALCTGDTKPCLFTANEAPQLS